jgi:formate hydrogenlyase subunit 3/multisubunit Na+/H+ antiporter MnhD subunit
VLAANLVVLLFFWGGLLAVTYGLLLSGRDGSDKAAAKALTIIGLSDFAMLLGVVLLLLRVGSVDMAPAQPLPLHDGLLVLSFLLVGAGALAKAGSMPFHTWIPAAAGSVPATVLAFVPASVDKLLGIYLLTRLCTGLFDISSSPILQHVLMTIGVVTILGAVMMAVVQKRVMRLLSFHAVSQVGYMVLGIGTGTAVGIAGGLFHMLNNSLYKSSLFLAAGSVETRTRTDEVERLGGLASRMPVTFLCFLVSALAISGIPPFNGFVSKWMVYQGVVELAHRGSLVYPLFLIAAMLGSVLTLASFLKLLHSVFFGQRPAELGRVQEASPAMWLPNSVLALACVAFGLFAFQIPLAGLVYPSLPFPVAVPGVWQPALATVLMLIAFGIGALIYLLGTGRKPVTGRTFVGGERVAEAEEGRVAGTAFYSPVKHLPIIDELLRFGEAGAFDLHNWVVGFGRGLGEIMRQMVHDVINFLVDACGRTVRAAGRGLSQLATGSLPLYVGWVFIGAVVFYLVFFLR